MNNCKNEHIPCLNCRLFFLSSFSGVFDFFLFFLEPFRNNFTNFSGLSCGRTLPNASSTLQALHGSALCCCCCNMVTLFMLGLKLKTSSGRSGHSRPHLHVSGVKKYDLISAIDRRRLLFGLK